MKEYRLSKDQSYNIPNTSHERRLVVFQRLGEPLFVKKAKAMERYISRIIESEQKSSFQGFEKLFGSRGIRKQKKALVAGSNRYWKYSLNFELCEAWIGSGEKDPPPQDSPVHLNWYQLSSPLFQSLDVFGTGKRFCSSGSKRWKNGRRTMAFRRVAPYSSLFRIPKMWVPSFVPLQRLVPIRSFCFQKARILTTPKLSELGGNGIGHQNPEGPSLAELPEDLPCLPLSAGGRDIAEIAFPDTFAFLPGNRRTWIAGAVQKECRFDTHRLPCRSLNAATATAIALYAWSNTGGNIQGVR
jgi:hypothetical protein